MSTPTIPPAGIHRLPGDDATAANLASDIMETMAAANRLESGGLASVSESAATGEPIFELRNGRRFRLQLIEIP